MDNFFQQLREKQKEKLQEKKASRDTKTFSVFLRDGSGQELEFQNWVYEEVCRRSSMNPDWTDDTSEFEFRSHPILWEVYQEFNYSIDRDGRDFLKLPQERYPPSETPTYTFRIEENIPLALKPYTRILDFHSWGEILYFDYDAMKVEILNSCVKSGNINELQTRYDEIKQFQERYPNKYLKNYEGKCVRIQASKPQEIYDEQQARLQNTINIIESDEGRNVLNAIEQFNSRFPEAPMPGEIPSDIQQQRETWNADVLNWYNSIQTESLRNLVDYRPNRPLYTRMFW